MITKIKDYFEGLFQLSIGNFFWWFIGLSIIVYAFEIIVPWRKNQSAIRKDFWLDTFYMFFNMYIFPTVVPNFIAILLYDNFMQLISIVGIENPTLLPLQSLPWISQLFLLFLIRDFLHFNIHRLLHRVNWLWQFHKIHHSVKEMGYAAHLRYHWVEGLVYKILEFFVFMWIGFSITDFIIVYVFTLFIGHLNHANLKFPLGVFKYLLNNPQMHIWHHAKQLPNKYGVNFGLTLSVWDYIFKTDYIPKDGRDIELGFDDEDKFPKGFLKQFIWPIKL